MSSRWIVVPCLWVLACGGGAPAKSADDAPPDDAAASGEAAPSTAASPDDEGAAKDEAAPAKDKDKDTAAAPASADDARAVLQLVIDDEALQPYLHLDKPDRFPFRIGGGALPQGLELSKATKPVIVVADPSGDKKPILVVTELSIQGDDASVRYRYDVEKVRGSSTLKRREGHWVLLRSRITEH